MWWRPLSIPSDGPRRPPAASCAALAERGSGQQSPVGGRCVEVPTHDRVVAARRRPCAADPPHQLLLTTRKRIFWDAGGQYDDLARGTTFDQGIMAMNECIEAFHGCRHAGLHSQLRWRDFFPVALARLLPNPARCGRILPGSFDGALRCTDIAARERAGQRNSAADDPLRVVAHLILSYLHRAVGARLRERWGHPRSSPARPGVTSACCWGTAISGRPSLRACLRSLACPPPPKRPAASKAVAGQARTLTDPPIVGPRRHADPGMPVTPTPRSAVSRPTWYRPC